MAVGRCWANGKGFAPLRRKEGNHLDICDVGRGSGSCALRARVRRRAKMPPPWRSSGGSAPKWLTFPPKNAGGCVNSVVNGADAIKC
eukprot:scaffold113955_cov28-Attheya_sp.AAC.1